MLGAASIPVVATVRLLGPEEVIANVQNFDSENPTFEILLVEDNPSDVFLIEEAFKGNPLISKLHVVSDGDKAIAFLHRQGSYAIVPRPDLILLDLDLPGTSGHEVLKKIKDDDSLMQIPVVVLTSSESDDDRLACYNSHANAFITKPADLDELQRMVTVITEFWFTIVKLPPH